MSSRSCRAMASCRTRRRSAASWATQHKASPRVRGSAPPTMAIPPRRRGGRSQNRSLGWAEPVGGGGPQFHSIGNDATLPSRRELGWGIGMLNWGNFISQLFNGLVSGALLALISAGLTIVYGTLGVLNLAHGALFMLGGYAGFVAYQATGSFVVAVLVGTVFVGIVGVVFERVIVRFFYARPEEDQILVTFGAGIVLVEIVRLAFGSLAQTVPAPVLVSPIINLGFVIYPEY